MKEIEIKHVNLPKSGSVAKKVTLTAIVTLMACTGTVAWFANNRPDMVWAVTHQGDVELVQVARGEVNKQSDKTLKEAVARVFIPEVVAEGK